MDRGRIFVDRLMKFVDRAGIFVDRLMKFVDRLMKFVDRTKQFVDRNMIFVESLQNTPLENLMRIQINLYRKDFPPFDKNMYTYRDINMGNQEEDVYGS